MKRKYVYRFLSIIVLSACWSCGKSGSGNSADNHPPSGSIKADMIKVNPFTYEFSVSALDQDLDQLTYTWDFGEGTTRTGASKETFNYAPDKVYTIKVKISDGKATPTEVSINIDTKVYVVTTDNTKNFQTIEGFGGFGAMKEYWSSGPFTSPQFVNDLINDLGLTILRDNIPSNFESVNDNADPYVTDLSKFNLNNNTPGEDGKLGDHIQYLKDMKAAGLQKLIVSVWSPALWMKYNGKSGNGTTSENFARPYNYTPDANTNQLKLDMYQEFAENIVAYIRIIKQQTGIDVYAISLQNEPRFSQFYSSCVYDGAALRNIIKVVGKRLEDEALDVKLFLPEDVGWLDGIQGVIKPTLDDPDARKYVDMVAVHGYATDGVAPGSTDAQTWQTMYSWGAAYNIPMWMTETSGFAESMEGAVAQAKAMYVALKYGNVSAWLFWSLSTTTITPESVMDASGNKSKRYFVLKNFYRYIRPGARRFEVTANEEHLLPLAFSNTSDQSTTIVIVNNENKGKPIRLSGTGLTSQFTLLTTSVNDNCKDYGAVNSTDVILVPANGVVTLYKRN